jgi:hypothetical protein
MGIEPTLVAWEATVLPLNYTRTGPGFYAGSRRAANCSRRQSASLASMSGLGVLRQVAREVGPRLAALADPAVRGLLVAQRGGTIGQHQEDFAGRVVAVAQVGAAAWQGPLEDVDRRRVLAPVAPEVREHCLARHRVSVLEAQLSSLQLDDGLEVPQRFLALACAPFVAGEVAGGVQRVRVVGAVGAAHLRHDALLQLQRARATSPRGLVLRARAASASRVAYGSSPNSSSQRITPSEYTSLRMSTSSGATSACSGPM